MRLVMLERRREAPSVEHAASHVLVDPARCAARDGRSGRSRTLGRAPGAH